MIRPATHVTSNTPPQNALGLPPCALLVVDASARIRLCNEAAARMLGAVGAAIVGEPAAQLLPDIPWAELLHRGGARSCEVRVEGSPAAALTAICEAQQWDGQPALMIELRSRIGGETAPPGPDLERFQARAERSDNGVCVTDREGRIVYANTVLALQTGYALTEIIGSTPRLFRSGEHPPAFYAKLWETLEQGREFCAVFINRRKSGELYYEKKRIRPFIGPNNRVTHYVATGRDISQNLLVLEKLEYLANHDSLTGLPNRSLFRDRLHREFIHAGRYGGGFAVCYVDVDQLKPINDLYGHAAGDSLLLGVSRTLSGHLRKEDTVARLGGDEFGLILKDVATVEGVRKVLSGLMRTFKSPQCCEADLIHASMSVSIGVALFPRDGGDEVSLMTRADQAMYRAKASGGGRFRFFSRRLDARKCPAPGVSDEMAESSGPSRRRLGLAKDSLNPDLLYYLNLIDSSV